MDFQYTPYIWPSIASAAVTLLLAVYATRHLKVRGALAFGLSMLLMSLWSVGYALQLAGTDLPTKLFWNNIQVIGYTSVPFLWLIMVFQLIRQDSWVNHRNIFIMIMVPILTIILAWTNNLHNLMWRADIDANGTFSTLTKDFGIWFRIFLAYAIVCILSSGILLALNLRRKSALFREQSLVLFIGMGLLSIFSLLEAFEVPPFDRYNPSSAVAGISGIIIASGVFRFRLFDIVPVARDNVIENMADGLIVLDSRNRIADINPAARAIFGYSPVHPVGQEAGHPIKETLR